MLRCPKCGSGVIVLCLASYPAKYDCECLRRCGYELMYYDRKNSCAEITQEELNEDYKIKWNAKYLDSINK